MIPWVITKTSCDGIGNVMKGFISALRVNPNTTVECNPHYSLGQYDTVLDSKHMYTGGPREHFYTCRFLVLRSEECEQETIVNEFQYTNGCGNPSLNHHYSLTKLIDWNYDMTRVSPCIQQSIRETIDKIQFQPYIVQSVDSYVSSFRPGRSLGISVRTWTASHEQNVDRPYSFEVYMNAIRPHLSSVSTIVLSVDNDAVIPEYLAALQHDNVIVLRGNGNETQNAFIKMLTLSMCDVCIANRISTFSELVFWFGNRNKEFITVF